MTLQGIMERLLAEGYTNCHFSGSKQIILPGLGEVELAYGEAKIFDSKLPWPGYGNHQCTKSIDELFDDIHKTWPIAAPIPPVTEEPDDPETDK